MTYSALFRVMCPGMKYVFFLLTMSHLVFFTSCQTEFTSDIKVIQIENIPSESPNVNHLLTNVLDPVDLNFIGDNVIYQDQRSDSIFTVIDSKNLKKITSFGLLGRGPNEFANTSIFGRNNVKGNSKKLVAFNSNDRRLYHLQLLLNEDIGLADFDYSPISQPLLKIQHVFQDFVFVEEEDKVVFVDDMNYLIQEIEISTGRINKLVDFANEEKEALLAAPEKNMAGVLSTRIGYHKNRRKYVLIANTLGYVQIYNNDFGLENMVSLNESLSVKARRYISTIDEPIVYTLDLAIGKNEIFILYINETFQKLALMQNDIESRILIFDFNLELLQVLSLNYFVVNIALDEGNGRLFAHALSADNNNLITFDY